MARTDAVVLGAGIVGTSIALHLAKRGLSVALVDKGGPGEGTSYGNAGVIEGNTLLPHPFPNAFGAVHEGRAQARDRGQLPSLVPAAASRPGCSSIAPIRRSSAASATPT